METYSILLCFLFPQFSHPRKSRFLSTFEGMDNSKRIPHKSGLTIKIENIKRGEDKRTSVLIRNLPNNFTKEQLRILLEPIGNFNFIFIPFDKLTNKIYGIAFVNFINYKSVMEAYLKLHGTKLQGIPMKKFIEVKYSKYQGKAELSEVLTQKKVSNDN